MMTPSDRSGSPIPSPSPPTAALTTPPTPVVVAEPPSLWGELKSFFHVGEEPAVAETKSASFAEQIFCKKFGILSACDQKELEELGSALMEGATRLFDTGKEIAQSTLDSAGMFLSDPFGFLKGFGPSRHSGGSAPASGGAAGAAVGMAERPVRPYLPPRIGPRPPR